MTWIATENLDMALLRSDEAEQGGDRGGLAGPVRSQKRKYFAPGHVEVEPIEGDAGSIAVGDVLEGQRSRTGQRPAKFGNRW